MPPPPGDEPPDPAPESEPDPEHRRELDQLAREMEAALTLNREDLARALFDYFQALQGAGFDQEQAFALVMCRGLDRGSALFFWSPPLAFKDDWRKDLM